ncbi:snf7 family protein [Diaporthe eres]|nr:snf7 family protein [Diaporthe eres]
MGPIVLGNANEVDFRAIVIPNVTHYDLAYAKTMLSSTNTSWRPAKDWLIRSTVSLALIQATDQVGRVYVPVQDRFSGNGQTDIYTNSLRPAHAKEILLQGTFAPSPEAKKLSVAPHFDQSSTPIIARFSNSTGLPNIPDNSSNAGPRGFALRFQLATHPRRVHTDIFAHSVDAFPGSNGDEALAFFKALKDGTAPKPAPQSFANEQFFGVNAFKLIDSGGAETYIRYRIVPAAGLKTLDEEGLKERSENYLFDEIPKLVEAGPVVFKLRAQVAEKGDVTDDACVHWPEERKVVDLGTISLEALVKDDAAEQKHSEQGSISSVAESAVLHDHVSKARVPALYSDFRGLRSTNPDGYQANISAWRRGLAGLLRAGLAPTGSGSSPNPNHVVLKADESLLRALESKQYGRPLALGAVIREATQERDLIPVQDFLKANESIYYKPWSSIPWSVASWGFRHLGLTGAFTFGGDDRLPGGQFVVVANVEAASKAALEQTAGLTSRFERTFSKVQFQAEFKDSILKGQQLSETDMEVLLRFMSRDQGVLLYDGKTVKIRNPDDQESAITVEDETIASLRELAEYLNHQTTVLNNKIEELTITARQAVAKKNRVSAMAALKSKKLAESSLQQRFATLSQIEEVSAKIEQASDNVQLVKVMGASTGVLKTLNAQVGGAERVEEVVDHMREQMGQADEINNILAEQGPAVDEEELDDELEAMLQEQTSKEDELERSRREAAEQKQAEDIAWRLADLDAPQAIADRSQEADALSGEMSKMSLKDEPQREEAS